MDSPVLPVMRPDHPAQRYLAGDWTDKRKIVEFLRQTRRERRDSSLAWVSGHLLGGREVVIAGQPMWIGDEGKRRARELAMEGAIERKMIGRFAHYRFAD